MVARGRASWAHRARSMWISSSRISVAGVILSGFLTSHAWAVAVRDLSGLTSITFIESSGSNKEFTFARNDPRLLTKLADPIATTPIRTLPGLVTVTFIENTGSNFFHTFLANSSEMMNRLPDPLVSEDFHGTTEERYDVFYSDADGTHNNDGAYITIEVDADVECQSGGGLNISEVRLDRGAQTQYGTMVASAVYLGDNAIPGSASVAVDGNLNTDCTMGNTAGQGNRRLRLTVGFGFSSADFRGVIEEQYDVYYSDANGTRDNDGAYITVEAVWPFTAPSGGGLNISEVRLNRDLLTEYANVVLSPVYLGDNSIPNSAGFAADGDPATDSSMGNTTGGGRLRIVLGFASSSGGTPAATRFEADVDDALVAYNGSTGEGHIHLWNHGSTPKQMDWWLDTEGLFEVQPQSGTVTANPGETVIDVDFLCNCLLTQQAGPVTFRTTNADGDNAIGVGTWTCTVIVGVPALGPWSIVALTTLLLGGGMTVLRHRQRTSSASA